MLCTWFEHVKIKIAVQAGLLKYANQIVVAQKRSGRSKKMWDEMLVDEIKKLGMDPSDHQNLFESLERMSQRKSSEARPSLERGKQALLKWI